MYKGIVVYADDFGTFTYGEPDPVSGTNPMMNVETSRFDIASLTKVTTTTTAVMQVRSSLLFPALTHVAQR